MTARDATALVARLMAALPDGRFETNPPLFASGGFGTYVWLRGVDVDAGRVQPCLVVNDAGGTVFLSFTSFVSPADIATLQTVLAVLAEPDG